MSTMNDNKKMMKRYRDNRSAGRQFVNPTSKAMDLYCKGRTDYITDLMQQVSETVARLQQLGVNIDIVLG